MKFKKNALSALMILYIQFSWGQEKNPDTSAHRVIDMGEIVISVNKSEETKRTIAQQVQVLNADEIAGTQSQSTAEVVASTGNVFVQKSQMGGGSPVIRGFEANRILLVIDGIRMNNIIYRGGHLQNIVTLDNSILERMEVLYGPSSTIYGSDALGGVIHLYTKKPMFAEENQKTVLKANAFSRYGTVNNEFTAHADFNLGSKKLSSLTSITYSKFGDLKGGTNQNPFYKGSFGERPFYVERINGRDSLFKNKNRYKQVQSGYHQYDLLQKISFRQNEFTVHGLNFQFSSSGDVPRYDRLTDPSANGLKFAEWYYGPQKRLLAAYDMEVKNPSLAFHNIHAGINYQNIEESRHTRRFGNDQLQHRIEKVQVFGADIDFHKIIKSHQVRIGVEAQYNSLKSTANEENIVTGLSGPLDTRYPDGKNSMMNAAIYISHTWHLSDNFVINDGLRFGYNSLQSSFSDTSFFPLPFKKVKQNNPVYSGSLGLVHTPSEDMKLSVMVSTGFRTPNVDDLAKVFESAPGTLIVPNENLKPEKTINTEAGISKIFNGHTRWENSLFYTQFIDAIVTDKYNFNGQDSIIYEGTPSLVLANQNKGKAYLYGFSSNLKSQCTENFSIAFSMNYTYARIKTDSSDTPLDHIPPFMMRLQLNYTYKKFASGFIVNYNGWKRMKDYKLNGEDNEQYATPDGTPAWFTANMHVSYKIHKLITLQAGIENIFDTQYRTFASGINAPGRNVYGAIRFHY